MTRQINPAGLELVKRFEGCKLTAYLCPAKILTIGYGSTGKHVTPGLCITPARAEALLRDDLARFEEFVEAKCAPFTDNQFAALVSLAFNVGNGNLQTSTLRKLHRAGDYAGAAGQFQQWNKARVRGKLIVLAGLTKRRAAESALYAKL